MIGGLSLGLLHCGSCRAWIRARASGSGAGSLGLASSIAVAVSALPQQVVRIIRGRGSAPYWMARIRARSEGIGLILGL